MNSKQLSDISLLPFDIPSSPLEIRKAFAIRSMAAKCGMVHLSVLQLLIRTFESFHLTYEDEPVIGWREQEGEINSDFKLGTMSSIDFSDINAIPCVNRLEGRPIN